MSQSIWDSINPDTTSGTMLAGLLNDFKDALMSGCSGTSRPPNLQAAGMWIDTTNESAPSSYWSFKVYTGTTDIEIFRLSVLSNVGGTIFGDSEFDVKHVAADTAGAILSLVKNRIDNNGQVLDGDTVAELRFIGTTSTGTQPITAYMRFTASDDEATNNGGTLSFASTADGAAALTEHFRLISGQVETVKPHKINSQRRVSQNIATTATIAALDASKVVAEMTGSTATDIQGIDATKDSQVITIHNRSTAVVTLKHENASATSTNRIKLPKSADFQIAADSSATLYYCSTDARWKIRESAQLHSTRTTDYARGVTQAWTAPLGVTRVSLTCFPKSYGLLAGGWASTSGNSFHFTDAYGNMYAWGNNSTGILAGNFGDGTIIDKSSPVAVLGGLQFSQNVFGLTKQGFAYCWGSNTAGQIGDGTVVDKSSPIAVLGGLPFGNLYAGSNIRFGLSRNAKLYAWGNNLRGVLGVGDNAARSSPVAVVGGLSFHQFVTNGNNCFGLTNDGTAYAWGANSNGQLGVGDAVARSSPVAVLGGLKFAKICTGSDSAGLNTTFGITTAGAAYAWGGNSDGCLGVGDRTVRSSPVAVLGGLTFADIVTNGWSNGIFAMTTDGTPYAWGGNNKGQLGLGDIVNRSSPVAVLGGLKFGKIVNFGGTVVGLTRNDGIAYAWGLNPSGSLGVGDVVARSSPVAVLGGLQFVDVVGENNGGTSIGFSALATNGFVYAWGINTNGELGLGDVVPRSSPVAVIGPFGIGGTPTPFRTSVGVTPGSAYTIQISQAGQSYFGSTPIGENIDYIAISYIR